MVVPVILSEGKDLSASTVYCKPVGSRTPEIRIVGDGALDVPWEALQDALHLRLRRRAIESPAHTRLKLLPCHSEERSAEESSAIREKILRFAQDDRSGTPHPRSLIPDP